jgi:hypothetical protein
MSDYSSLDTPGCDLSILQYAIKVDTEYVVFIYLGLLSQIACEFPISNYFNDHDANIQISSILHNSLYVLDNLHTMVDHISTLCILFHIIKLS